MRDDESDVTTEAPAVEVTQEPQADVQADTQAEAPATQPEQADAAPAATEPTKTPEELAAEAAAEEAKNAELFTQFEATVTAAVEARDQTTGDVPSVNVAPVKLAYAALTSPAQKKKARDFLDAGMKTSLTKELNASKAKVYMDLGAEVKTTTTQREQVVREPVDPTQAHVEKVASFYLAVSMITPGEGVNPDWTAKVQELSKSLAPEVKAWQTYEAEHAAWLTDKQEGETDEAYAGREPKAPEVHAVVLNASKIARGRGASVAKPRAPKGTSTASASAPRDAYAGPKRSVKAHIAEVFANEPIGTFLKTGAIAKAVTSEYPDGKASSGAITAALGSPKFNLAGIIPAQEGGVGGARKVA
jgi:hypothetical protein